MIWGTVTRNEVLIMDRQYADSSLTLEDVLKQLKLYVKNEQLNTEGECRLRVRRD